MMTMTQPLWNAWRGRAATPAPVRPTRPRRAWHLDPGRAAPVHSAADEAGDDGDGSWFASSHELAAGLLVTEHHGAVELFARTPG